MVTKKVFLTLDQAKADRVQELLGLASTDETVDAALDRVLDDDGLDALAKAEPGPAPPPESWWDPPAASGPDDFPGARPEAVLDTQPGPPPAPAPAAAPAPVPGPTPGPRSPGPPATSRMSSGQVRAVAFRTKMRGYDPRSVDDVLGGIVEDLDQGRSPASWLTGTVFPKTLHGYHPDDVDALMRRLRADYPP